MNSLFLNSTGFASLCLQVSELNDILNFAQNAPFFILSLETYGVALYLGLHGAGSFVRRDSRPGGQEILRQLRNANVRRRVDKNSLLKIILNLLDSVRSPSTHSLRSILSTSGKQRPLR
jgi:hypothetical protein